MSSSRLICLSSILLIVLCSVLGRVVSLAAAGKNKKRNNAQRTNPSKGFGAAPPLMTKSYPNLLTDDSYDAPCPCQTRQLSYRECCAPFHQGQEQCASPLDVLRTRYSAFSFRIIPYIIQTTHPTCRDYQSNQQVWAKKLHDTGMFDSFDFISLDVIEQEEQEDVGWIDFTVTLRSKDGDGDGDDTVVREWSKFLRSKKGVWTYASGEVRMENTPGLEDAILNNKDG